jgi:hypothetical protein
MIKYLTVVFLTILLSHCSTKAEEDPKIRLVENLIRRKFLPASHVVGLSLSIVKDNGERVFSAGYGYKDLEKKERTGADTLFAIASISKVIIIISRKLKTGISTQCFWNSEKCRFHHIYTYKSRFAANFFSCGRVLVEI